MQNSLKEALRAVFTVDITGDSTYDKKLCLLPGSYNTMAFTQDASTKAAVLTLSDPTALNNAGYACDQVADDHAFDANQVVTVRSVGRSMYRDFLNSIQRVGMRCTEIVIKNLAGTSHEEIFDQQIEVAKTVLGAKGGMDFITLQKYVNVNAYDRSKITIDLSGTDEYGNPRSLDLTPEVFMAITVPAASHFSMQFTFDNSVSGL